MAALETARRSGASWLERRAVQCVPWARVGRASPAPDGQVTARELEVVTLVSSGLTNREIAGELYISIRTVTSHLDHVYTKLDLSSRDQLIAWFTAHERRQEAPHQS